MYKIMQKYAHNSSEYAVSTAIMQHKIMTCIKYAITVLHKSLTQQNM